MNNLNIAPGDSWEESSDPCFFCGGTTDVLVNKEAPEIPICRECLKQGIDVYG